jgi:hypothetical protein
MMFPRSRSNQSTSEFSVADRWDVAAGQDMSQGVRTAAMNTLIRVGKPARSYSVPSPVVKRSSTRPGGGHVHARDSTGHYGSSAHWRPISCIDRSIVPLGREAFCNRGTCHTHDCGRPDALGQHVRSCRERRGPGHCDRAEAPGDPPCSPWAVSVRSIPGNDRADYPGGGCCAPVTDLARCACSRHRQDRAARRGSASEKSRL